MGHCLFQSPQEAQMAIQELRDVDVAGRPIWIAEDSKGGKGPPMLHLCPFSKVIAGGYGAYPDGIAYLTSAGGGPHRIHACANTRAYHLRVRRP
eukprot:symbB.v1.2.024417.t1/scaffold2309.1/size82710/3